MLVSCQCLRVITVVTHIQAAWHLVSSVGQPSSDCMKNIMELLIWKVRGGHVDSDNCRKMHLMGVQRLNGDTIEPKEKKRTTVTLAKPTSYHTVFKFIVSKDSNSHKYGRLWEVQRKF